MFKRMFNRKWNQPPQPPRTRFITGQCPSSVSPKCTGGHVLQPYIVKTGGYCSKCGNACPYCTKVFDCICNYWECETCYLSSVEKLTNPPSYDDFLEERSIEDVPHYYMLLPLPLPLYNEAMEDVEPIVEPIRNITNYRGYFQEPQPHAHAHAQSHTTLDESTYTSSITFNENRRVTRSMTRSMNQTR